MSLTSWLSLSRRRQAEGPSLSFEQLFNDHAAYVGRCLRYLGVAEADLEDCCQEVFLVVHRRVGDLAAEGSVRGWIRGICVHVAQNQRRSKRRRREEVQEEPPEIPRAASQEATVEHNELRAKLLEILDQLSEEQRHVFVLYEIEQMTMAEVASAVRCPLQTAYSRLHAARAFVQTAVQRSTQGRES